MFKEKLMIALTDAVSNYNESRDPNEAILKAAEAHDFNIEQTRRLCESFNTAHAVSKYGMSKNASEASQPFKLANVDIVLGTLFDPKNITKEASFLDTLFSDELEEYAHDEKDWNMSVKDLETSAELFKEATTLTNYDDLDLNTQLYSALNIKDKYTSLIKEGESNIGMLNFKYSDKLNKLASAIKREWPEKQGIILGNMLKWAVQTYGAAVEDTMKDLGSLIPNVKVTVKTAGILDTKSIDKYIPLLKEALECNDIAIKLASDIEEYKKYADAYTNELNTIVNKDTGTPVVIGTYEIKEAKFSGKGKGTPSTPQAGKEIVDAIDIADKSTSAVTNAGYKPISEFIHKSIGDINSQKINEANKIKKNLDDYDMQLEHTSVLQDLVLTDPILSSEDPKRIGEVYNNIIENYPNMAKNKEVIRSILRAAIQTEAIDAYDAAAWGNMEKNIRELDGTYVSKSMKVNEGPIKK